MSPSVPGRKFAPEPIETSTRSSRRFQPEPVETTTRSSRRLQPEPVERTVRSSRRVAPESLESSTRVSRKQVEDVPESAPKPVKRFEPEPIETTISSSRSKMNVDGASRKPGRFAPQPIETVRRSNKKDMEQRDEASIPGFLGRGTTAEEVDEVQEDPVMKPPRPRRRFAPQLIETARRSRKSGDTSPALLPQDKTEVLPQIQGDRVSQLRPRSLRSSSETGPFRDLAGSHPELKRVPSPLARRRDSQGSSRQHSFRIPDLEPIASSESGSDNESGPASQYLSSRSSSSERLGKHKDKTRMRESVDDRFSGYLLDLAAKAAQKQLREQAMAAFPNDDFHEPVDHFIDRESGAESEDDDYSDADDEQFLMPHERLAMGLPPLAPAKEKSTDSKINWELLDMQKHAQKRMRESRRQERESMKDTFRNSSKANGWINAAAYMNAINELDSPKHIIGGWQRGVGLRQMRNAASPPMLGGDLVFPRCPSPEPARFDVTQGSQTLKKNMCYLIEQTEANVEQYREGLWKKEERGSLLRANGASGRSSGSNQGLWNGYCYGQESASPVFPPSGLMTPAIFSPALEMQDPMDAFTYSQPPSPTTPTSPVLPRATRRPVATSISQQKPVGIDELIKASEVLEQEFSGSFVTQVYNYLSLGYPALARKFDYELSKISGIPVEELRADDLLTGARGYIRLGDDMTEEQKEEGINEETCARWQALKLYIHEWARQQPRMREGKNPLDAWGTTATARRGSWAF